MKSIEEILKSDNLILMCSQEYPIDSKVAFWGGMGVVTKEVSERLVKKGFEVLVVPRRVKEYAATHGTPKGKKDRANRNAARTKMEKAGRVKKGDGKEVDHKDFNPRNNGKKNLRVVSKKTNRKKQPARKPRKKK